MKITDLKLNENNPRYIKTERFEKLKQSIKEFPKMLELRPIIYDPDTMNVLGGNMRLRALLELDYQTIPKNWTKPATELTEEEKERFIVVDNIGFGEWDYDILANKWDNEILINWGVEEWSIGIQHINELEEWKDLPEFNKADKLITLMCHFKSEQARQEFIENNKIKVSHKLKGTFSCYP